MRYDSFFNHALDDFYRSAALVSSVILFFLFLASPAEANYIYDNKTGSWTPTSRTVLAPPGSSSPFNYVPRDTPPSVSSTGAFQNKTGGTFGSPPVNGASRTVPVTVNGTTTKPNVNKALLSRLGKGGLAGLALGAGIDALLDGIGALIDEGGNVVWKEEPPSQPCFAGSACYSGSFQGRSSSSQTAVGACSDLIADLPTNSCSGSLPDYAWFNTSIHVGGIGQCYVVREYHNRNGLCQQAGDIGEATIVKTASGDEPPPIYAPVPPSALEDAIESGYQPHPSDYPFLSSDPAMQPTIVEVEPISRLDIPPATTTTVDLDTGETTVVETNIWQDFNVKDNNTNQPKIEAETTTKSDTYVDGEQTSSTTITNNTGLANPEGAYDSAGNRLDIPPPVDCDLFPTACAWMEWTQEEPEEPDDDLSELLQEVPIVSETFTITGGAATCPAPLVLNLSQFGSREVSYQPLCDLASTMKFLYLALMSFAAAVLLHRSINRV